MTDEIRWISPAVIGTYHSEDWSRPIAETLDAMASAWEFYECTGMGWAGSKWAPSEPHPAELTHGGPLPYVEHLVRSFLENGYDGEPIMGHRFGPAGLPTITNGNHRAIAAILAGIEVPVRLI